MAKHKIIIFFLMFLHFYEFEAALKLSQVKSLPGFSGTFPSKHYSGYVKLDGNPPKNLFYYFVVSERNPATDAVVLWLNGGPGCSSFDGFVYGHGPFNFGAAKKKGDLPVLHLNPYSWSKVANMIYLDSPAGVGFSYSANTPFYETGDVQTANDTHLFLLKWFEQYPEFNANPFYIAGESYAGIYVPTLASEIVKGLKMGIKPIINLKGYMVGNGVSGTEFDGINAVIPFAHGMGLISDKMFKEAQVKCKGNYIDPYNLNGCSDIISRIDMVIDLLNQYDILEPCYHSLEIRDVKSKNTSHLPESFKQLGVTERPFPVRKSFFGRAWPFRAPVEDGIVPSWPQLKMQINIPCVNDEIATHWLNKDAVRKAIHADPESGDWRLCVDITYSHDTGSMISYHKSLTASAYRVLIFSGDHDMIVPYTGTQAWIESLGYKVVNEWRPWMTLDEAGFTQISGFIQEYAHNFTFLTIKGAGHRVPEHKPKEALEFFQRWLDGEPF